MIEGVVLLKDMTDKLGRKYRPELIDINQILYGELGYGSSNVDLEKVSHKVVNLRIVDNSLYGDIVFLYTPNGMILKALHEEKVAVTTSIRALAFYCPFKNEVESASFIAVDVIVPGPEEAVSY